MSGPRAAVKHLDALERKGQITRKKGLSRGIELIGTVSANSDPLKEPPRPASLHNFLPDSLKIPLLGAVPAGTPELAIEDADASLVLDRSIAREGTFLLRVEGHSMAGDHIIPGDLVVVRPQETAEEGEIVVVLVGDEATLKRCRRKGDVVYLVPSNPDYETIILDGTQGDARIIGKMQAVIRIAGR
jgi:repressor LexA